MGAVHLDLLIDGWRPVAPCIPHVITKFRAGRFIGSQCASDPIGKGLKPWSPAGRRRAERPAIGMAGDDATHNPKAGSLRPAPFSGVEHAAKPPGSRRSAPRPPPPPQPSTFSASAHVTGPPARRRPRRRLSAPGRVPAWHLFAPFSGIDAAQQAQQGHQLRNLPATVRAIREVTVERGTLRLHETADQVGAQREADVVILSAHHVTAPRKTSDRTTCPLTIPGVVRFTAIPACGPGHRHRS